MQAVQWIDGYTAALNQAKAAKKPLFVDFFYSG